MADFYPAAVRDAELQGVSTEELKRLAFDSRSGVEWLADSAVFELAERAKKKCDGGARSVVCAGPTREIGCS